MTLCLFILENLGKKEKRIQTKRKKVNPSLNTEHHYYFNFCVFALSVTVLWVCLNHVSYNIFVA